jgi:hypothetical protein
MNIENAEICTADIQNILEYFSKTIYKAKIETENGSLVNII